MSVANEMQNERYHGKDEKNMNQPTRQVKNPPTRCNEIVMMEESEPVKSNAHGTGQDG